jgi:FtsZ-interacting cell division protein ZipA
VETFWLKVAAVIVVIIAVIVGVVVLMPSGRDKPKEPAKTIYDMAEKDKEELLAAPSAKDFKQDEAAETNRPQEEQSAPAASKAERAAEPMVLYFTEVPEEEGFEAENILATIPSWRTIGRMPFTGYNVMVESCRLLMSRWPGSRYDYMARRALAQVLGTLQD